MALDMEFDDIFDHIGHLGLYQVLLFITLGLLSLFASVQNLAINFLAAHQDHWCHVPRLESFSFETQKYVAIPVDEDGQYDQCKMFDIGYENLSDADILTWNSSYTEGAPTIDCTAWTYDQSEFVSTVLSEFDLVCDKSWLNQLGSTIFMAGMLLSGFTSGLVSDKIGRYKTCVIGLVTNLAVSIATAFVPEIISFMVFRGLNAFTSFYAYLGAFMLVMEIVGPGYRVSLGMVFQIFFSVGFMFATAVSYAIRDWRWFQLAISLCGVVTLMFIGLMPESPRWLLSKGRVKEAEKVLRYVAKVNRTTFPEDIKWDFLQQETDSKNKVPPDSMSKSSTESIQEAKFSDICSSPILRREISVIYLNWFTCAMVYYGLSLNTAAFGDVFLNTFLSGLIEIPANLLCWLCLEKGGRRFSNAASLLVAGAFCLACVPVLLVDDSLENVLTGLSTIGKGAITFAFSSVYLYTAEMFHTPVRHLAVGSASTFGRIGSMAAPYIGPPLEDIWIPMPSLIFGAISTLTGAVCFLLPETKGHELPDTKEQAEEIGRSVTKRRRNNRQGVISSDDSQQVAYKDNSPLSGDNCFLTRFDSVLPEDGYVNPVYEKSHI